MNPDPPTSLQKSIETLYRVFGRYQCRWAEASTDSCSPDVCDPYGLKGVSLQHVTAASLDSYLFDEIALAVDANSFKHFLPRILELIAQGHGCLSQSTTSPSCLSRPDADVTFEMLADCGWDNWPAEECEAVKAFMHCFWRCLILLRRCCPSKWDGTEPYQAIDQPLACLSRAYREGNADQYLSIWRQLLHEQETRGPALATLVALIGYCQQSLIQFGFMPNCRHKRMETVTNAALRRFLGEPWLLKNFERWYFEFEHEPFAPWISSSLTFLEWASDKDVLT